MSYSEKLLREFIRHAMGNDSDMLNEELTSDVTAPFGGANPVPVKFQTYREKWGVDRANPHSHPWLWMLGLGEPVADLWDSFFGPPSSQMPGGGWFYSNSGSGVTQSGASVVDGFDQRLPGSGGAGWVTTTGEAFPNSAEVLAGRGSRTLSEVITDEGVFEDEDTFEEEDVIEDEDTFEEEGVVEEEGAEIDFLEFSAAVNNDLHTLVRGVEDVKGSIDAVTALERFNEMFGETPNLSDLRRDFEYATDDDIDKQALLDLLTQDVVPNFVSHVMDVGVGNMISNLAFNSRQVGELESLLAQAKIRL